MDPVARVRDVLDIRAREKPLDLWVIVGAESTLKTRGGGESLQCEVNEETGETRGGVFTHSV